MRFLLILLASVVISCAKDPGVRNDTPPPAPPKCPKTPEQLVNLRVGDSITSSENKTYFEKQEYSEFRSGTYCNKGYDISLNKSEVGLNDYGWCYYYSIDVDCETGIVTSIYSGK